MSVELLSIINNLYTGQPHSCKYYQEVIPPLDLPFLKPRRDGAALIVKNRKPDGTAPESHSSDSEDPGLLLAAEDLCKALKSEDYLAIAKALRAAFEIADSEPHAEGEHIEDENE